MALENTHQPDYLPVTNTLRLRKYDGHYEYFLSGYQDPVVYQNSEGIFDPDKIPDLAYMQRMCSYLSKAGELYYIEVLEGDCWHIIGDVTVKPENPPIAIWEEAYRGKGIGFQVMKAVIRRLKTLGYETITCSTVYRWNKASAGLHEKLGFQRSGSTETEYFYELDLTKK